ncbi:lipoate--protein ligase family protein [Psychromonas aquatilis]|uniref:Lipoate--protein ligase n=1 Tax=Psychromonas aquatilis TaxID=2005072 RepID=A0ABU9GU26_9GAMM
METNKYKISRLTHTSTSNAFEKEDELVQLVRSGKVQQALLLWRPSDKTLVLPSGNKWQQSFDLITKLKERNWDLVSRRTGGAPVPQTNGVINLSHIYQWNNDTAYSIHVGYEHICEILTQFFSYYDLTPEVHETPYSYCDGSYNLNINNQKIVGTAQRVLLGQNQQKVILVQACILIDANMEELIYPVKLCNQFNNKDICLKADVHTCLKENIHTLPTTEQLYDHLLASFVRFYNNK